MSFIRSPILYRWIDILLLVALLLVLGLMFQLPLCKALLRWNSCFPVWTPFASYAAIMFSLALLSVALIHIGSLGVKFRVMTMLRYPPSWFASIIVFMFVGVWVICGGDSDTFNLVTMNSFNLAGIVSAVSLGVLLGFLYHVFEVALYSTELSRDSAIVSHCHVRQIFADDDALLDWILGERPIRHPNQDIFDRSTPARRIARLLGEKAPSRIGIVGSYGCGKTSFVNLILYHLDNPSPECTSGPGQQFSGKIIYCRVDGWGRSSGTVASKILFLAIEEVKKYVDCASVIALPENYQKAIAGARSVGGAFLSSVFHGLQDSVSQLCRLDNILAAANLRLVIVLEDLDRNMSDGILGDEMPALLDRLRILNNVSFVLAIGTGMQFSDILIRICDHVEAIS